MKINDKLALIVMAVISYLFGGAKAEEWQSSSYLEKLTAIGSMKFAQATQSPRGDKTIESHIEKLESEVKVARYQLSNEQRKALIQALKGRMSKMTEHLQKDSDESAERMKRIIDSSAGQTREELLKEAKRSQDARHKHNIILRRMWIELRRLTKISSEKAADDQPPVPVESKLK